MSEFELLPYISPVSPSPYVVINFYFAVTVEIRFGGIGLWHEIQNRLKYTWFDVVFHADSDSIFFFKSIYRYVIRV
jgi:hypothetical protein